jgi:hypothetical protein
MCATVNEPGVQYTWMAQRRKGNAFTPLSRAASEAFDRIGQALVARAKAEGAGKGFALDSKMSFDCLHKLEALAYHLSQLRAYKAGLLKKIGGAAARVASWRALSFLEPETVFEFEALLLQARATLDTVTWCLSRACGQKTSTFRNLEKVLSARAAGDTRIEQCLVLLNQCPWMSVSKELVRGDRSTRTYVAHYGSLLSVQQTCFTASRVGPDAALLFDMEMHEHVPLMATASKIHEDVPFFVTGALSVFLDLLPPEKEAFATDLAREFVVLSEALVPPGEGTKVGVVKEMGPDGFTIGDVTVSADTLAKAVTLGNLGAG